MTTPTPQGMPGSPADGNASFDAFVAKRLRDDPDGGREKLISLMIANGDDRAEAEADVAASIARLSLDGQQPGGGDGGIGETVQASPERETGPDEPMYDAAGRLAVGVHDRNPIDPARNVRDHLLSKNEPPQVFSIGPKAAAISTGKEINPLDDADWLTYVASKVTFMGMGKQGPVIVAPPAAVMRMVPALLIPRLPALDGVIATPYFDASGTLVSEDGYNPGTRLILRKGDLVLPPVPDVPSAEDVARARHLIETEWLGDFRWAGYADRANAIACLLTVTGRPLFPLVPMFVIDASVAGAGKGLFASTLCLIAMGEVPQFIELPSDKEEQRKKITTALLAGRTLIAWDEAHVIGGHSLAMALTAETYGDRILGGNKMMSVDNRYTMVGLGNNVQVTGDMKRRVVPARLVPDVEHPEHLTGWRHDPLPDWVRAHRGELLWAALVIWRNWMAQGRAEASVTMGSFERWARAVGGALEAAGIEGFLGSTAGWLDDSGDDDAAEWAEHLAALHAVFGKETFTAKDVVGRCIELPPFRRNPDEPLEKGLGYAYRSVKERWLGGWQLVKTDKLSGGRAVWRVVSRSGNVPTISSIPSIAPNNPARNPEGAMDGIDGMVQVFPERESPPDFGQLYNEADMDAQVPE